MKNLFAYTYINDHCKLKIKRKNGNSFLKKMQEGYNDYNYVYINGVKTKITYKRLFPELINSDLICLKFRDNIHKHKYYTTYIAECNI